MTDSADRIARLRANTQRPGVYMTPLDWERDVLALCDDHETLTANAALFDKAAHKLTFTLMGIAKREPPLYNLDAAIAEYDTARSELRRLLGSTS